jgi:hypothetical protein
LGSFWTSEQGNLGKLADKMNGKYSTETDFRFGECLLDVKLMAFLIFIQNEYF